jgi:DNA polymerase-1
VDALPSLIDPFSGGCIRPSIKRGGDGSAVVIESESANIPIRTELGREIRAAFVPQPGVEIDYRGLFADRAAAAGAHVTIRCWWRRSGTEDIHTRTAAEVFGIPPLMITPEQRRNAKAVNFGIVYGQTPFGLAATLGIGARRRNCISAHTSNAMRECGGSSTLP